MRGGLDSHNMVFQPVFGRTIPFHGQEAIFTCQLNAAFKILVRDGFAAVASCSRTQQLGGRHRHDCGCTLRQLCPLFIVQPFCLGKEVMT